MPSENILKLRELTHKINLETVDEFGGILKQIKKLLTEISFEVGETKSYQSKVRAYEKMCLKLNNYINNTK